MYDLIDLEKRKVDISERAGIMTDRICGAIHKYKPDYVVFEDVAMRINPQTLILLARLQGTIIGYCRARNIPYSIISPPSWRKILGFKQGKGVKRPELKKQAKEYVKSKYGLSLSEDICEAVCIGDAFLKMTSTKAAKP